VLDCAFVDATLPQLWPLLRPPDPVGSEEAMANQLEGDAQERFPQPK
jgi:hypothetical protein